MIEVRGLTKRYGDTVAVDDLTFEVRPGVVTGFIGPNGAGKSTTMRMILGHDRRVDGISGAPAGCGEPLLTGRLSQPISGKITAARGLLPAACFTATSAAKTVAGQLSSS